MKVLIEHSDNDGRTWKPKEIGARTPLANTLKDYRSGGIYHDGVGNAYRWPTTKGKS